MNLEKFLQALSEILSEKYNADVRVTVMKGETTYGHKVSEVTPAD